MRLPPEQGCCWGGGEQPGQHGLGWVGCLLPAVSSARAPLEGKRSGALAQHAASLLLGVGALGNNAALDRKIGLCTLSPAV